MMTSLYSLKAVISAIREKTDSRKLSPAKLLSIVLLFCIPCASASSLFEENDVIEVSLEGPLGSLIEAKDQSGELPFLLRANGVEHSIKVRLRGKSRRSLCSFPPLRLNFSADDTAQSVFAGQDKLKLVTHCLERDSAQADLLQEYAAYRIFNLLSAVGYRVRLLHVTYLDTDGGRMEKPLVRYGFVIESSSELADRVGGQQAYVSGVSLNSLDSQQAATVYTFQYQIGNTDWSLVTADGDDTCCHNVDLFDIESARYLVPYDFDLSGLVNARYAKPDPSLRISRVTRRLYRGYCISTDVLKDAVFAIKARSGEVFDVINQIPGLSQRDTESTIKYVEQFFAQADDEAKMVEMFDKSCL